MNKTLDLTGGSGTSYSGDYVAGTLYSKGTIVQVDGWLMVANKNTNEYAAPRPIGDIYDTYSGVIGSASELAKELLVGNRYITTEAMYIKSYDLNVVAGNHYVVYMAVGSVGDKIVTQLFDFVANASGWINFNANDKIIGLGVEFDIFMKINEPSPTPVQWNATWNYVTPNNTGEPLAEQIVHANSALSEIKIHKTSSIGDRSAELEALLVGDIISADGNSWSIQSLTDMTTYMIFGISPAIQLSADTSYSFTFETVTATPIAYAVDIDYNLGDPNKRGLIQIDGGAMDVNDNAYGINLGVQGISIPEDWDILALPSSGATLASSLEYYYQKEANILVPNEYNTTDCELSVDLPAGTYEIAYAFEVDFTGSKDKSLLTQLTGTWAGSEFYDSMGTSSIGNLKTRYYSFPKEWEGGLMTHGLRFKDDQGNNGFIVNFVDVVIKRVK